MLAANAAAAKSATNLLVWPGAVQTIAGSHVASTTLAGSMAVKYLVRARGNFDMALVKIQCSSVVSTFKSSLSFSHHSFHSKYQVLADRGIREMSFTKLSIKLLRVPATFWAQCAGT